MPCLPTNFFHISRVKRNSLGAISDNSIVFFNYLLNDVQNAWKFGMSKNFETSLFDFKVHTDINHKHYIENNLRIANNVPNPI